MFELSYDILDDLGPIESRSKQRIIDEIDKETLFPEMSVEEWYSDVYTQGCNLMFTLDMPIRFEHILGDKVELIETLNLLLERYFGKHPRIQAVYVGATENVLEWLDTSTIPIERRDVSKRFLNDILPSEYPNNRLVFKMPVKLNVDNIPRTIFHILDFLAAMWPLRNKYGLKYSMCFCRLNYKFIQWSGIMPHEFITCREPYELKYTNDNPNNTGWIRSPVSMLAHLIYKDAEKNNTAHGACYAWINKYKK